jgi:hypothetical protein
VGEAAETLKTPPLARRAELLGTIALHWKTPPLARRAELLGTIALHWKKPPLKRRVFAIVSEVEGSTEHGDCTEAWHQALSRSGACGIYLVTKSLVFAR